MISTARLLRRVFEPEHSQRIFGTGHAYIGSPFGNNGHRCHIRRATAARGESLGLRMISRVQDPVIREGFMKAKRSLSLGAAAALLLLGACGDDGDASSSSTTAASATTKAATATTAASATTAAATATTAAAGTTLKATLTGAAEAPGPGDPDGTGTVTLTVDSAKSQVCYNLTISKIDTPTGMHIHKGAAGAAGAVVVPFTAPTSGEGSSNACVSGDAAVVKDIEANPAGYYFNVHTQPHAAGALRGQLSK